MIDSLDLSSFDYISDLEKITADKDKNLRNIINDNCLMLLYIEKHNCKSYFMNDVFFIEEIIDSTKRANLYISNSLFQNHKQQNINLSLEVFRNKYQPNNTLYVGNFSYEEIVKYFAGLKSSILSVYNAIMVSTELYILNGRKVEGYYPVFVDIDEVKERLNLVNVMMENYLSKETDYIKFDELYFNLDCLNELR